MVSETRREYNHKYYLNRVKADPARYQRLRGLREAYYEKHKNSDSYKEKKRAMRKRNYDKLKATPEGISKIREYSQKRWERNKENPHYMQARRESSHRHYLKVRKNPDHVHKDIARSKAHKAHLKEMVLQTLGNVCVCCGETNPMFLTVDHVRNDGSEHRRRAKGWCQQYQDVLNDPDPTKYQILCFNCNLGRARNGGICPHKQKETSAISSVTKPVEVPENPHVITSSNNAGGA